MKRLERIFGVDGDKWNIMEFETHYFYKLYKKIFDNDNDKISQRRTYLLSFYSNHLKHSKISDVAYKIRNTFTLGSAFFNHDDD